MSYRSGMWQTYTPLWSSVNHAQYVIATGGSSGTFTLTYSGQTTASIAYNASAATVQTALINLSNLVTGDVFCTGGPLPNTAVVISFQGALIATAVADLTVVDSIASGTAVITGEPQIGNGTIAGRYRIQGKSVDVEVTMRPGSTSTYGANGAGYAWSLPTAVVDALADVSTVHEYHGNGYIGGSLQHWPVTTIIHGLANLSSTTDRPEMRAICHTTDYPAIALSSVARLSNVAAGTVPASHDLRAGDQIVVDTSDSTFDGTFSIIEHTATSIRWAQTGVDGGSTSGTVNRVPSFGSAGLEGSAQPIGWYGTHYVPDVDAFADGAYWCLSCSFELA